MQRPSQASIEVDAEVRFLFVPVAVGEVGFGADDEFGGAGGDGVGECGVVRVVDGFKDVDGPGGEVGGDVEAVGPASPVVERVESGFEVLVSFG
jgi:hypothetical protein